VTGLARLRLQPPPSGSPSLRLFSGSPCGIRSQTDGEALMQPGRQLHGRPVCCARTPHSHAHLRTPRDEDGRFELDACKNDIDVVLHELSLRRLAGFSRCILRMSSPVCARAHGRVCVFVFVCVRSRNVSRIEPLLALNGFVFVRGSRHWLCGVRVVCGWGVSDACMRARRQRGRQRGRRERE